MKKLYLALFVLLLAAAITGCGKEAEQAPDRVPSQAESAATAVTDEPSVAAVTAETEATEDPNQHSCNFERYQEPLLDYPSEIWDTTGDEWEELPYNTVDAISLDMYYKGFTEIDFCGAVKPDPYNNLGACEMRNIVYTSDGTHFQIEFTHITNVGTQREVSLNYIFRAEHTDELVDISSVGNPDAEAIGEPMNSLAGTKLYIYGMKCEEGDSALVDISLFYSPSTGNMYSLTKETPLEVIDKIIKYNDGQSYDPIFLAPYSSAGPNAIVFPLDDPSTYEFTIKYSDTEETKTFTFKIGSTFKEWASSKYNTDGWKVDPADNTRIISADGKYFLLANNKIKPTIIAKIVN